MSKPIPQPSSQNLNISDSVLENVQIGGIAGGDLKLTQIQGRVGSINVFGTVQVPQASLSKAKPIVQQEYRWRKVLLNKVRQFWIDGVLKKSIHTQVLIELGLENLSDKVLNPLEKIEEFPSNSRHVFPEETSIDDVFEGIGSGRTLLILGEPGSGKTVTLLKLAESLISRAENDIRQPLPVVMNLFSWAKQRKSIAEWLVQELHEIYGASKSLTKVWVNQEQLILLLDGLDEVDAQSRNDCVKALNHFILEHGLTELVVCSRIQDYEKLSERLKLRSAIYIRPLTPHQIDKTLGQLGEPLSNLQITLQKNAELRTFASSPLILSIMSLAYQDSSTELINQGGTPDAQRKRLFDTYISRMFARRGTTRKYSKKQTLSWLIWLAQRMLSTSQSIFLIEQIQPNWLISRRQRLRFRVLSALTFGLIFGSIFALISAAQVTTWWVMYVLVSGLLYGTLSGLIVGLAGRIEPVETLKWSWREARKNFRKGLAIAVPAGLMLGFLGGFLAGLNEDLGIELQHKLLEKLIEGLLGGLFLGLFLGLLGGLYGPIAGLIGGFRGPEIQNSIIPNQGIWKSFRNSLLLGLMAGLIFGLVAVMIVGVLGGLVAGLKVGLITMLNSGLLGGLIGGGSACFRHFILRLMLYRQGNTPWNYVRFLDYATDRLFLQKVGGGYIFIHRMLLEHFAQMELEPQIVSSTHPQASQSQ